MLSWESEFSRDLRIEEKSGLIFQIYRRNHGSWPSFGTFEETVEHSKICPDCKTSIMLQLDRRGARRT